MQPPPPFQIVTPPGCLIKPYIVCWYNTYFYTLPLQQPLLLLWIWLHKGIHYTETGLTRAGMCQLYISHIEDHWAHISLQGYMGLQTQKKQFWYFNMKKLDKHVIFFKNNWGKLEYNRVYVQDRQREFIQIIQTFHFTLSFTKGHNLQLMISRVIWLDCLILKKCVTYWYYSHFRCLNQYLKFSVY